MVVARLLLFAALQQAPAAAPVAETVVVTPTAVELEVDGTRTFEAEVRDAGGRPIADPEIRWIVPEADVASIDQASGRVTALRPGRANVFAVYGGKVGRAVLTVPQLPVVTLDVVGPDAPLRAGESVQATVVGRDRLGDEVPVVVEAVEPDDINVAWGDASGRIYGVTPGETSLRFSTGSVASMPATTARASCTSSTFPTRRAPPKSVAGDSNDSPRYCTT